MGYAALARRARFIEAIDPYTRLIERTTVDGNVPACAPIQHCGECHRLGYVGERFWGIGGDALFDPKRLVLCDGCLEARKHPKPRSTPARDQRAKPEALRAGRAAYAAAPCYCFDCLALQERNRPVSVQALAVLPEVAPHGTKIFWTKHGLLAVYNARRDKWFPAKVRPSEAQVIGGGDVSFEALGLT